MLTVEEAQDLAPAPAQQVKNMGAADVVISQDWVAAVDECTTAEEVTAVWQSGVKEIQAAGDKPLYDRFKAAVAARGAALKDAARTVEMPATEPVEYVVQGVDEFVAGLDAGGAQ